MISERQGIEIDYCPSCRGVWLDRGELDKIIERSASFAAPEVPPPAVTPYGHEKRRDDDDDKYKRKKRKNFLDDLFDF